MRQLVVTVVALLLTAPQAGLAQGRQGGNRPAPPPPTRPNVPPPPITYPFGPLMPPPAGGLTPRAGEGPPFRTGRSVFFPRGSTAYAPFIFGYPEPTLDQASGQRSPSRPPAQATGLLRLSVTPASAQVFVDALYVGTVDDVNAQGGVIQLEAGPHRLEFRAPGYTTQTVDVRINPLETVTYRTALDYARPPAAAAPPAAGPPTVMYLIPKCYLGNLPPRQSRLPSGCDVKQVQVLKPAQSASRP